jgi:hypothetical protein
VSPHLLSCLLCTFFKESATIIHSERRRGQFNIHFAPFDHSSYSKYLWKCKNNYDILKIYIMIKHVIVK